MHPAETLALDKAAFASIQPRCPYVGACGGCTLQDLRYEDQLALKQTRLQRILGPLTPAAGLPIIAAPTPWRYRNKAELTFGTTEGRVTLGYHAPRSFWRIVDIDDCLLLPEAICCILRDVEQLAQESGLPAYHVRTHQGFFRYLVIRSSTASNQVAICLITTAGDRRPIEQMTQALMQRHPALHSVYWGVSSRLADAAQPEELFLIRGAPWLDDRIGPFQVQLGPLSFLQPNTDQAARAYEQVMHWVGADKHDVAWDLYCGIGLISLYLATTCGRVYGIECEERNVELARRNAQANHLVNLQFHLGKTEDVLARKRFWLLEAKPDVVVVDPPRAGLHERVIAALLAVRPESIVYVSCNAQTLARDIRSLMRGFPRYRLAEAVAFDFFPQTPHVEVLTRLERISRSDGSSG